MVSTSLHDADLFSGKVIDFQCIYISNQQGPSSFDLKIVFNCM